MTKTDLEEKKQRMAELETQVSCMPLLMAASCMKCVRVGSIGMYRGLHVQSSASALRGFCNNWEYFIKDMEYLLSGLLLAWESVYQVACHINAALQCSQMQWRSCNEWFLMPR